MTAFVDRYGPWAFCRDGHLHLRYEAQLADGQPKKAPAVHQGPTPGRVAPELVLTDDRGVPLMKLSDDGRLGRSRRPIGAQWLPDLQVSAVRVNALRAIVANVSRRTVASPALWDRLLLPGQSGLRSRIQVATLLDQERAAQLLLGWWLVAEHVEMDQADNGYASGPAGALALALRDESNRRLLVGECRRCGITWRPGRRRDGGATPPLCPRCAEYERLNDWRTAARAKSPATGK